MAYENKLEIWWNGLPGEIHAVLGWLFDAANESLGWWPVTPTT